MGTACVQVSQVTISGHRKPSGCNSGKMGRPPVYLTEPERLAAAAGARKRYDKMRATRQRASCIVKLSGSQTRLDEPPQLQAARALLIQARALLEEVEPGGSKDMLRVLAASDG